MDLESSDPIEAIEACYRLGWSDGLPLVPPTDRRVAQFLSYAGRSAADIALVEPVAGRVVTAEKAAANAVMAGCLPEYFPVVLAALEGMSEKEFNLHGASLNTGGAAVMAIVNGQVVNDIGLNSGVALFSPGFRPNATIGRALQLVLWNSTGNRPDELDETVLGHPGRYSMCIAEREAALPSGWLPLHVETGMPVKSSAVTVVMALHPIQTSYGGSPNPRDILTNIANTMTSLQPWNKELFMIVAPEILRHLDRASWTKENIRTFLFDHARRRCGDYRRHFKMGYPYDRPRVEATKDSEVLPVLDSPDALKLVAGGGDGGPFVMIVPVYGIGIDSRSMTKLVR